MEHLNYKPIFDCTLKEIEERLRPEIEKVEHENLSSGLYNIYRFTGNTDNFIRVPHHGEISVRQYATRKEFVAMNPTTGTTQIVKRSVPIHTLRRKRTS